jgi:hypothetical protein
MPRTKIFVSYSHEDVAWLSRIEQHFAVLERRGLVELWSDTRLPAGAEFEREIEAALSNAKVAVLLVSPSFLASRFIWQEEIPRIEAHTRDGMDAIPLIVRPAAWRLENFLRKLVARPADGRPLSLGAESLIDADLMAFTYEVAAKIGQGLGTTVGQARTSTESSATGKPGADPTGSWEGLYNETLPMRLFVQESDATSFRGRIVYPGDDTITIVQGSIYQNWSPNDQVWAQINSKSSTASYAITFKELEYARKGGGGISFNGEYRALVTESNMSGAWFDGKRLVGYFTFDRVASDKKASGS